MYGATTHNKRYTTSKQSDNTHNKILVLKLFIKQAKPDKIWFRG